MSLADGFDDEPREDAVEYLAVLVPRESHCKPVAGGQTLATSVRCPFFLRVKGSSTARTIRDQENQHRTQQI